MPEQAELPGEYVLMGREELARRIVDRKRQLGGSAVVLAHHYQPDEIVELADFVGDSFKLSRQAAKTDARHIVFCGVHFMAESADVLSGPEQIVCLPNMRAGCSMADLADATDMQAAMDELRAMTSARIVPVTYVNSSAAVKALTGRSGGACCTSSNVRSVFEWAIRPAADGGAGAEKIFVAPDQHLGRNTAVAMGFSLEDCVVYDPSLPAGGLEPVAVERAKFILWKGCCYVHQLFHVEDVQRVRRELPGIRVVVHPECPHEVVRLADASGSTEQIIRIIEQAPAGTSWAIGTEANMVRRLARRRVDLFIRVLSDVPAICVQMARIDLPHLLWVLDNLAEGRVVNRVSVSASVAADARVALERMINIVPPR